MTRLSLGLCGAEVARQLLGGRGGRGGLSDEVLAAIAAKSCGYMSHKRPPYSLRDFRHV